MRRVVAVIACCLALSGCATAGGVQVEGVAAQVTPPPSTPPPPSNVTPSADVVSLLRTDPQVSANIKALLTPCLLDRYPVDARYVDVTQDGSPELIVTVVSCDGKSPAGWDYRDNLAEYVYSVKTTPPSRLFAVEEPGAQIIEQPEYGLMVSHSHYLARDKPCCPSGVQAVAYKWNGTAFDLVKK